MIKCGGGIQRSVQLWISGDQTDAVLDIQGSGYTVTYQDKDGGSHEFGGGFASSPHSYLSPRSFNVGVD